MTEKTYTPRPKQNGTVPYKAFAGLRNDVGPERFGPADLAVANNVDIDKTGALTRRAGYTRRAVDPAHSLWAQGALGLFVSGTQLRRLNVDFSSSALMEVGAARMAYCSVGDRVYFTNGTATGVFENNAARSWGLPVPALPTASLVGGDMAAGTYQFSITHTRADGQESGAPLAGVIRVAAGQCIRFDLPLSTDTAVVDRSIYLTPPDGETLYLAMTVPAALRTYTVFAADVDVFSLPLATQLLQPPPVGQLVAYYKGRMFVAVGAVLYMSEPFAHELFDLRNYIELDDTITLLAPLEDRPGKLDGMFVGTEKSCGVLAGSGPDDFQYVTKAEYGAIPGTTVYVDGALVADGATGAQPLPMWLSTQGVCTGMPMLEIANQTRGRYDMVTTGNGAAVFMSEHIRYVAVCDTATVAMRSDSRAVTTYTNYGFNSFARFNQEYLGAGDGGIYALTGDTDAGTQIDATVRLGITDFGSAFVKSVERLYVGYWATADMLMRASTDDVVTVEYPMPAMNSSGVIHGSRVKLGKGLSARYWQFEVRNTEGGNFMIDVLDAVPLGRQRRAHA